MSEGHTMKNLLIYFSFTEADRYYVSYRNILCILSEMYVYIHCCQTSSSEEILGLCTMILQFYFAFLYLNQANQFHLLAI